MIPWANPNLQPVELAALHAATKNNYLSESTAPPAHPRVRLFSNILGAPLAYGRPRRASRRIVCRECTPRSVDQIERPSVQRGSVRNASIYNFRVSMVEYVRPLKVTVTHCNHMSLFRAACYTLLE